MNGYKVKYASHTQVLLQVNTGIHNVKPSTTHGALTVMSALQDKLPTVNGEVVPMMAHGDGMRLVFYMYTPFMTYMAKWMAVSKRVKTLHFDSYISNLMATSDHNQYFQLTANLVI